MAGENDNSTFFLNLDASDFISQVGEAKGSIAELADSESLSGLIKGLGEVGIAVGVMGAAFFAVKESMDMVFDAENIKSVNAQFDILTQSAGVMGDKLKEALIQSGRGWVDETTLIEHANKALVQFQGGADKIPELMEIARKATSVFGGSITDNFDRLAEAVASGRTQALRYYGIQIDMNKAYKDYAASIGVAVGSLSKAGQQQAILNQAITMGREKFKNVDEDIRENINLWEQLKAIVKDIGETIALAFDNIAGPALARFFGKMKGTLETAKTWLQATIGHGSEQAAASVKLLNDRISDTKQKLDDIKNHKGFAASMTTGEAQIQTQLLTSQLKNYEAELGKADKANEKFVQDKQKREAAAATQSPASVQTVDPEKRAQQEAKAAKEIAALDTKLTQQKIQNMDSVAEANALYDQQRKEQAHDVEVQIQEVKASEAAGTLTKKQAAQELIRLNQLKDLAMQKDDATLAKMQEQALDNYKNNSETVFEGVGRAFQSMSLKNQHALKDFGAQGDKTAQSFGSHMTNAFQQIGSGAKSGTDAMKDAFFGMIGDVAAQYGQMMMLASIFPPNPPVFAAGAALEMLSGMLGSMSSGSSPLTPGSAATGISGDPGSLNNPANPTGGTSLASSGTGPKSVNLIVQGNVFNNDQTQRWLVDQIRQAADATDFKVSSIGGGL